MFNKYFSSFNAELQKKIKPLSKPAAKAAAKAQHGQDSKFLDAVRDMFERIIPADFAMDKSTPIDSSGFSPEGTDLIIYRKMFRDVNHIFGGFVPYEMTHGSLHAMKNLNKKSLAEILGKIVNLKKLNKFSSDTESGETVPVPSFVFIYETDYTLQDLKTDITGYYNSMNLDSFSEFDIMMIFNKGIIVKNWREKRSFIALDTKEDTTMWFYILLIEYLDIAKSGGIDLRKYVKKNVTYTEY